jgi:ATP-dependent RNA circularization protein (DNA/RNA ligase family)
MYEKTYRIAVPQVGRIGKLYLTEEQVEKLLEGVVDVEEKLDGTNCGIARIQKGFELQKRRAQIGTAEHEVYGFFRNWAWSNYSNLIQIPVGFVVYVEVMFAVHSIFYDSLDDYIKVFDVWDGQRYLNREERTTFTQGLGLSQVPLVIRGHFKLDELYGLIPSLSAYGPIAEGIVVKRYPPGQFLRGKVVRPEFIKMIEDSGEHWSKQPLRKNLLESSTTK